MQNRRISLARWSLTLLLLAGSGAAEDGLAQPLVYEEGVEAPPYPYYDGPGALSDEALVGYASAAGGPVYEEPMMQYQPPYSAQWFDAPDAPAQNFPWVKISRHYSIGIIFM